MSRFLFVKEYCWEDLYDLQRDMGEVLDERLNPEAADIPGEYTGVIKVTVEYIEEEE